MNQRPYVYIVGAGPGDKELLTLKAYRLLTEVAEVVVYDRLIPDEIINMIPEGVERIYAGKSCRKHHMTQDEINACLVEQANAGKIIVRLKGGDPFIFGRGGEETETLIKHGINIEVVPGVSAATACSAVLGIPLTHRGLAHSVRYITGHQQKGQDVNLDWQGLADPQTTLVIYMGLAHIGTIAENLIKHGLDKHTPSVAIQDGTSPEQRQHFTTLDKLAAELEALAFQPPTLVVIGKVVALGRG